MNEVGTELVGRTDEVRKIDEVVADIALNGRALVLLGQAGVGKTTLLEHAVAQAKETGATVLRASGVRPETPLPFAGLHQLLRPLAAQVGLLFPRQRDVLRMAFGQDEGPPSEIYQVALAALDLISAAAATSVILAVIDDAHLLDDSSAEVMAFVSRRITEDRVGILVAVREGYGSPVLASDLPVRTVDPLTSESARHLLDCRAPGLDQEVKSQILELADGNPLAIVERPRASLSAQTGLRTGAGPCRYVWRKSSRNEPTASNGRRRSCCWWPQFGTRATSGVL